MAYSTAGRIAPQTRGIICVILGGTLFATGDMLVKLMSDGYPLHQIVWMRAVVGLVVILGVFVPLEGRYRALITPRWPLHFLRGSLIVVANVAFFTGIAAMPLAEVTSIFFVAPLLITALSIPFLGEKVGIRRMLAVIFGFLGVAIIVRPGTEAFQIAAIAPMIAALAYASVQIIARKIGGTEKASTMAFYMHITFLLAASAVGLVMGDGRFLAEFNHPSMVFLLRPWAWPNSSDFLLLTLIGVTTACGSYMISEAYRQVEATTAAPFEYVALPAAIFWSILVFGEWPDIYALIGIVLIVGSGIYAFRREGARSRSRALNTPEPHNR